MKSIMRAGKTGDAISSWFKEILACPYCKSDLELNGDSLICINPACKLTFPIIDGIPVMLTDLSKHHKYETEYFDQEFSNYNSYSLENWRVSYLKRILDALSLNGTNNDCYLDIGVGGSGYTIIEAARNGNKCVGLDISIEGVKKAKHFAKIELGQRSSNCAFVVGLAENLPFKNNAFSKLSSISVLEHLPNDRGAIADISRVIKLGGSAFITVPNAYKRMVPLFWIPYYLWDKRIGHLRHYAAENVAKEFLQYSFFIRDVVYTGHLVKMLQIALTRIIPNFETKFSKAWWKLENLDLMLNKKPYGLQLHIILKKLAEQNTVRLKTAIECKTEVLPK